MKERTRKKRAVRAMKEYYKLTGRRGRKFKPYYSPILREWDRIEREHKRARRRPKHENA